MHTSFLGTLEIQDIASREIPERNQGMWDRNCGLGGAGQYRGGSCGRRLDQNGSTQVRAVDHRPACYRRDTETSSRADFTNG